jgi:hypothetical protein
VLEASEFRYDRWSKLTEEGSKSDTASAFDYFELDSSYIDTNVVMSIGINRDISAIVVDVNNNLISASIHLKEFSEKTIKPLKRELTQLLKDNKNRQAIINSIVTCIHSNIDRIKNSQDKVDPTSDNNGHNNNKRSEGNNARILVELASLKENTEQFFKDQYGRPYVAVRLGKDKILAIMPLKSSKYKRYLSKLFRENRNGEIIGEDAINNAISSLSADADFDGETIPLHLRAAWGQKESKAKESCIYYDMTDAQGRMVEISLNGWRIINGSDPEVPILFRRYNQTSQVTPDRNYTKDIFDRFLDLTNVRNEEHSLLLKVLIVSSFIPEIDHPILTTYGPQGAAKSFLLRLIKMLVDPSKPVLLTLLKNIPEFIQQVNHNYLAYYDNVKYIPYWLSDEICKAVTGIGHTKRELYSDDNDIIYEHRRIISINGINVTLTEPDALDRSIFIELPDIDEIARREKEELLTEFEKIRPKLLAYILDTVVKALHIKPTLTLTRLPRMADFTKWGEAISISMGYGDLTFIEAYSNNRNQQNFVAVEENIVGSVFVKFYCDYEILNPTFVGSPEMLHKALIDFAGANEITVNSKQFPKAPNSLVKKLKAIKSNLKDGFGIIVDIERDISNNSIITICRNKTKPDIVHPHPHGDYYEIRVQQKHLQSYAYILRHQTPYNNEVTSATSKPPITLQNSAGGMEATEVTSLSSGVDAAENDNIIAASSRSSLHNHVDTNSVSAEDPKLE